MVDQTAQIDRLKLDLASVNRRKTHCPAGHSYSGTNVIVKMVSGRPWRQCAICQRRFNKNKRTVGKLQEVTVRRIITAINDGATRANLDGRRGNNGHALPRIIEGELIDGQCTSIAAATHPAIDKIPVMIVEAAERADRAGAFIGHNRDRVAVTPTQIHVAALVGGELEALAIDRVCQATGVAILSVPSKTTYKAGETLAVMAIGSLVRGRGEDGAAEVLKCLVAAGCAPMTQLHIKAADLLLHTDEYSREIDAERLALVISTMGPKIDSEAKVFVAAHPSTPLWKAMAICWFKARRGGALKSQPSGAAIKTEVSSWRAGEDTKMDRMRPAPITDNEDRPRALLPPERKGESVSDTAKKDQRPELGRWQPGNHLRRCGPCGTPFVGGRKAEHCADCAYRSEEVENSLRPRAKVTA